MGTTSTAAKSLAAALWTIALRYCDGLAASPLRCVGTADCGRRDAPLWAQNFALKTFERSSTAASRLPRGDRP